MSIRENIAEIRRRIDEAARETGRTGADITLVGASKMNDAAACQEAIAAGIDVLGENRVQEMVAKLAENAYDGAPLHFIGHLQRNKVKQVVGKAALIQSAGSVELLEEIEKQAEKLEEKLRKNRFTLQDYYDQLQQLRGMGDLSQLADMMPGNVGRQLQGASIDPKVMAHTEAIILSMTPEERENPQILGASRKKRIAKGCGLEVVDVNRLLKQFEAMQQMLKQFNRGRLPGMRGGFRRKRR